MSNSAEDVILLQTDFILADKHRGTSTVAYRAADKSLLLSVFNGHHLFGDLRGHSTPGVLDTVKLPVTALSGLSFIPDRPKLFGRRAIVADFQFGSSVPAKRVVQVDVTNTHLSNIQLPKWEDQMATLLKKLAAIGFLVS